MPEAVIDCHVHLYPAEVNAGPESWAAAAGEPRWAALCTRRRRGGRPVQSFPGVADLLRAMDAAGVERAVLLGWYWERPATCAAQNRFYAGCVRSHPDRLVGFATVRAGPDPAEAAEELRRAVGEGLRGVGELFPQAQGYRVSDPGFLAVLEIAAEGRLPVVLHATDPEGRPYPGRVESPLGDFLELAASHPSVDFVLAHWGGMLPFRLPGAALPANLHFDTAASPLVCGEEVWPAFLAAAGRERVLFGSDYPLNLYPRIDAAPDMGRFVAEARRGLPPEARPAVLRENALRLLTALGGLGPPNRFS